ncbi:serine/threonine-protein kinase 17A-like [Gigantopelta aegis]|uniref:serine/threonine-protein kinase 17A-like n=1 Tax=Gigantopelta aegis TaxID=1735272 RepID=UPI001B88BCD0|nr:serine/threonine-protein kinase 17A-like [Gigantopelta aegis]
MLSMNGLKVGKYIPNSTIKTDPLTSTYTIQNNIGRGKFAVVKKCIHNETKEVVAAKFIKKRRKGKTCREEILREVVMLEQALAHPRLVDLLEVYESPQELILVTEYCAGGELFQECVIEESFREHDVIRFLIQILEGLTYLHERNIVHLDLKPQNILLTEPFPGGNIKICDLGFACVVNTGEDIRDIIGTPDYVAPEVLDYEPLGTPTDMWSLGALTYVMLTAYSPFAGDNNQETFCNITQVKLDFPDSLFGHISPAALDFMRSLLVKNPRKRLTARQCLEHEWLKSSVIAAKVPSIPSPSDAAFAISQDLESTVNYSRRPSIPDLSVKPPQNVRLSGSSLPSARKMSAENSENRKLSEISPASVMSKNPEILDCSEMLTSSSTEMLTKTAQNLDSSEMLPDSLTEISATTSQTLDSSEMLTSSSTEMSAKTTQNLNSSEMLLVSSAEMCTKFSENSESSIISAPSSSCSEMFDKVSTNSELSFSTTAASSEENHQRDVEIEVFTDEPRNGSEELPVDKSDCKRKDVSMETSEELESPTGRKNAENDQSNSHIRESTISIVRSDFSFVKTLTLKIENKNKRHSMEIPMKKHKCNDEMEINDTDFCSENFRLISNNIKQHDEEMNNGECTGQHFPYSNNTTPNNTTAKVCVQSEGNDNMKEIGESSDKDGSTLVYLEKCSDSDV